MLLIKMSKSSILSYKAFKHVLNEANVNADYLTLAKCKIGEIDIAFYHSEMDLGGSKHDLTYQELIDMGLDPETGYDEAPESSYTFVDVESRVVLTVDFDRCKPDLIRIEQNRGVTEEVQNSEDAPLAVVSAIFSHGSFNGFDMVIPCQSADEAVAEMAKIHQILTSHEFTPSSYNEVITKASKRNENPEEDYNAVRQIWSGGIANKESYKTVFMKREGRVTEYAKIAANKDDAAQDKKGAVGYSMYLYYSDNPSKIIRAANIDSMFPNSGLNKDDHFRNSSLTRVESQMDILVTQLKRQGWYVIKVEKGDKDEMIEAI